jgi:hypothetical protein
MVTKRQAGRVDCIVELERVTKQPDGKFCFRVKTTGDGRSYTFRLIEKKALKIANQDLEFPKGVRLHIRGFRSNTDPTGLTFIQILSVDGHDIQAWAERRQSPTVAPDVLKKGRKTIAAAKAEEEAMKRRAPPEPPPRFNSPLEAYEEGMQRLRRQVRLKEPKLSKSDIWTIRDALNMLKEAAGL